ncbi:MAG: UDP-N-acetylmuramoyl-tripeptide--D-alanyl-D-alanine ligase [Clostridia bacterium]|nr:UDP-N-acetylmuramoyl-tripeptide--D-alanyl-D-alanine ligase [Clostridia bacterium]
MKNILVSDIIEVTGGRLIYGDEDTICQDFSKDTRTIKKGDIYIGIKGESFDGNLFYEDAVKKGAKVCILQGIPDKDIIKYDNVSIIKVEDTIIALQKIATYKRSLYNIPVIAITGSVGKTSTKDIIASVVSKKYKVLKTQGNLNNQIGAPLTVLNLRDHTAMVIELGMNQFNEISNLTKIVKPDIAIITNIGTAHIGNLGSKENILKAKLEILEGLKIGGTVVLNNDDELLHSWALKNEKKYKIVTYAMEEESDYKAKNIKIGEDRSYFYFGEEKIIVPIGGRHFIYNALCAMAVGKILGIKQKDINSGIEEFELSKRRMDISVIRNDVTIINDAYNANYDSMRAALEYLGNVKDKRKIAVLGGMLELGDFSRELHEKVGIEVYKNKIDILVVVGGLAQSIKEKVLLLNKQKKVVNVYSTGNNDDATEVLEKVIKKGDVVLFKASNMMRFEEIIAKISNKS